ncbi:helix-turn-helix domain-containing protein [Marinicella meishanensis]|uniref:helix-turn-helix domain-containing protein n=1 Tax=Marinicella meishanensis TaxID=2873263 RepID=UPI001CBEE216|nr:helix-turn-helix transcriptional regulator [Marinicella sp. NBU2979]
MNPVHRQFVADHESNTPFLFSWTRVLERCKQFEPLNLIWWGLAACICCATMARYASDQTGLRYALMVVLGSGGCAWFWLLSRFLFRSKHALKSKIWLLAPLIMVLEATEALMPQTGLSTGSIEFHRVFENVAAFICIAAIVLVWHEALAGFHSIRARAERRFRLLFLSGFSLPVAVAVLWVMGADANTFAGTWNDALLTACALFGLAGSRLAVAYRLRTLQTTAKNELNQEHVDQRLAEQVLQAMQNDALLTQPNLKVSDLADHLATQEYKVTRCITNQLAYRNFNQLVNHHRIERAIGLFKDPTHNHRQVATIAYDCGFNSLGPFNRAFKQHTDMTPREFRQQLLTQSTS